MRPQRPKWQFWFVVALITAVVVIGGWAFVYPFAPFLHPGKVRVDFSVADGCRMRGAELGGNRLMVDARLVWTRPGRQVFTATLNGSPYEQEVVVPPDGGELSISCEPPMVEW